MFEIRSYRPPGTAELAALKADLGLSATLMAAITGLGQGAQWRKYTGGADPRAMSPHMLFYLAAQLELEPAMIRRVFDRMRDIGAEIDAIEIDVSRPGQAPGG